MRSKHIVNGFVGAVFCLTLAACGSDSDTASEAKKAAEHAEEAGKSMMDDISESASGMYESAEETVSEGVDAASDMASDAMESGQAALDEAVDKVEGMSMEEAGEEIDEKAEAAKDKMNKMLK